MAFKTLYKGRRTPSNDELAAQNQELVDGQGLRGVAPITASKTLTWGASKKTQRITAVLTADVALTLDTSKAVEGARFRVVRAASATGSFNLIVGSAKTLATAGTWVDVEYDGANWLEVASGSL